MKRILLAALLALAAHSQAAISLTASNTTGVQDFATQPAATEWSTTSIGTAAGTYTSIAQVDAAAQTLAATAITTQLGAEAVPGTDAQGRYSGSGTTGLIYTAPTGVDASFIMATLQNDSGSSVATITISYDYTRNGTALAEEVMGHRVYYSLTGVANSWTAIPALSGISTNQTLTAPVTLSSAWAGGAKLYLLWADDNGSGSPDTGFTIDNFSVAAGTVNPPPAVSITAPTTGSISTAPATVSLSATATDNGSVTQVEFLRNGSVIHTDTTAPYTFSDSGLAAGNYTYTARATDNLGVTATSAAVAVNVFTDAANTALQLDGVNDYVTMGAATATLGAPVYTLECWFKRTGNGVATSTGSNGATSAVPLITKGRGEADATATTEETRDCNYFMGIDTATNKLCADFEAKLQTPLNGSGAGNNNYPVYGSTVIQNNVWYHAAAVWNGTAWKLFINGIEETTTSPNTVPTPAPVPQSASIQHFAIGSALTSTPDAAGFFQGVMDEVRVWNVARNATDIAAAKNSAIAVPTTGLLARYGMNEGSGTVTANSVGVSGVPTGTLTNGPLWVDGYPFTPNTAPVVALTAPTGGSAFDAPASISLAASATDADGIGKVEFFSGATKLGEDNTSPYELVWNNVISGNYALTAVATDSLGAAATSTAVNVSVTNTNNVAPSVSLTAPANGSTIVTNSVTLSANANDTDGVIAKVEFFNGTTKLGEDTTSPYSFNWTSVATGNYTITAVATDNDSGTTTSAPVSFAIAVPISTTLLAKGSTWKFLDNGSNQGTAWKETGFNDGTWVSGSAPLGYGDGHIVTTVNSPAAPNRYITTYFRRSFNVTGAAAVQAITLNILRDDGVVVYINGTEVARQNMPAGAVTYLTTATAAVGNADETAYFAATATPLPALLEGANTIAVELHQSAADSSDLGIDLELITLSLPGTPPAVAITAPVNAATFEAPATIAITADAADADGTVSKVEFFNGASKLGEDTNSPYAFDWTVVPQGGYTLTAKATDNFGLTTTSAAINITVDPPNTIPPTVAITAPADNANFIAPATLTITASAADSDGTVSKVEFFNGAAKLGEDASNPYTFDWTNIPAGDHTLTAKATDNLTAVATSAPVVIHVLPNQPPVITPVFPADLASVPAPATDLRVSLSDAENQPLAVTFYGRPKSAAPGPDFTLMTLPDTQFYSENLNNRLTQFTSQVNWIVSQRSALNIAFVAHMGDMVNTTSVDQEWINADGAMDVIEDPATTLLTHGIPWGGAPGNHDIQSGNTAKWNQYFGSSRWAGRPYFQDDYNNSNTNNYQFFSASGMDFIIVNLAYNSNTAGDAGVFVWADALLKAHPSRRAIITSHWIVNTGSIASTGVEATFGGHGQALYNELKDNPNLFLMLCGHVHGEGLRDDVFEERTVYSVLQDYQDRSGAAGGFGGGDGWLRYFVFSPANNAIYAKTYRTTSGDYETDANSQFTLPYNMTSSPPWTELATVNVPSGANTASVGWTGLTVGTGYEWYAAVSDGVTPVSTSVRSFTTVAPPTVTITATDAAAGESGADQALEFTVTRTGPTAGSLSVPLVSGGSASAADHSGFTGSVTIPATQASVAQPITVLADAVAEGPETLTLALGGSTNFTAGSPASADAGIADKPEQGFYFAYIADSGKRAPGDDADNDDNANVIEYFMGTLPADANSRGVLEIPTTGNNTFKVRYPRAKNRADVGGGLRWSANLTNWHNSGQSNGTHTVTFVEAVVSASEVDPEIIEATATITGAASSIFVRLGVQ